MTMGKSRDRGWFRSLFKRRVGNSAVSNNVAAGSSIDTGSGTQSSVVAPNPNIASDSVQTAKDSRSESRHTLSLWADAYKELGERDADLVKDYEEVLKQAHESTGAAKDKTRDEQMTSIIECRTKSLEQGEWKANFKGHELKVKDVIEPVVSIVTWAKGFVGAALETSPAGSLAWAGVCLLLPTADRVKALENLSETLHRCRLRETLYERRCKAREEDDIELTEAHLETYYKSLKGLCVNILTFQATCAVALFRNTIKRVAADFIKLEDWKTLTAAIKNQEEEVARLEQLMKDVIFDEDLRASRAREVSGLKCATAMKKELERLAKLIQTTNDEGVLTWLATPLDPSKKYIESRTRHGSDSRSGKWLIESEVFSSWKEEANSLLWLHGKAGGGKTILSSTVIHHLEEQFKADLKQGSTALAYYFFQFDKKDTQRTETMLRSLVANICRHRPSIPVEIEDLHRKASSPSIEDLEKAFRAATADFSQVFVIIDALDECPLARRDDLQLGERDECPLAEQGECPHAEEGKCPHVKRYRRQFAEREEVLKVLCRLNEDLGGQQNLRILLTSRPELDIASRLDRLCVQPRNKIVDLQEWTNEVNEDIAMVIEETFQQPPFDDWKEGRDDAVRILTQKSQGMFQYVALQIEQLRQKWKKDERQNVLENLPDGLDDLYERILLKIQGADQKFAHRALQFLACLDRGHEINVGELAEIMIVDSSSSLDHENFNIDLLSGSRFDPPKGILSLLQGLVVVSGTVEGRPYENHHGFENDCRKVVLSHFTVKEYLTSTRLKSKKFFIDEVAAMNLVAESYLWYHMLLSEVLHASDSVTDKSCVVSPGESQPRSPWFLTGEKGLQVADQLPLQDWTSDLKGLVTKVLNTRSRSFQRYYEFSPGKPLEGKFGLGKAFDGNSFPLLQFLIWFFDDQLPLFVIENSELCAINEKQDPYGTPTIVAARFVGKHKFLKALLEAGADPYIGGPHFDCALDGAILGQGLPLLDCILTLLEQPDPLRRYSKVEYWPLVQISRLHLDWEDLKPVFEKLLSLSPDIKCHEPQPGCALVNHISQGCCFLSTVDFLLDEFGSTVMGRDKDGVTALQWAAARAAPIIIERLIQHGALEDCLTKDWTDTINRLDESGWDFEKVRAENLRNFRKVFGQLEHYKVSIPAGSIIRSDVQRFMDLSEQDEFLEGREC